MREQFVVMPSSWLYTDEENHVRTEVGWRIVDTGNHAIKPSLEYRDKREAIAHCAWMNACMVD